MLVRLAVACLAIALAAPALAQDTGAQPAQQPPPNSSDQDAGKAPTYEEQVVVTASKTEEQVVNAPAAVSVVTNATIQNSPTTNVGDLLRSVPGVNVTQVSARDINITTRGATSTLSTSQLVLVDGRSIYLDFFGMVMWDLVPSNPNDIKQIEVIRGPASAVWGANAMDGVINVITKSPREIAATGGNELTIGVGSFVRDVTGRNQNDGALFYVNGAHAEAIDSHWSYKVSAGYFSQDPLPRPTGNIPNAFQTPYPDFTNQGTSQPKFDGRVDYDIASGGTVTVSGGVAGTSGIINSGIGPFDINSSSHLTYLSTKYQKGGRRIAFFTNLLDGNALNLLARSPNGAQLPLDFDTKTFDLEANDVHAFGTRHVVSYGGNFRHNTFDISLAPAPNADTRNEGGAYAQDEIFLNSHFRWVVGGRVDKFSSINKAVFSPRTTFMMKPNAANTFRVSFNRAFRAPSFINNNIDTTILNNVNLSALSPALGTFVFPITAVGNPNLKQETMTAYEIGYTGVVRKRANVTAAVYWNRTDNGIYFNPVAAYGPTNPPPGWPLPPAVLGTLAQLTPPVVLPSQFTYLNFGRIEEKGIELGVDGAVNRYLNVFTNYSYQWMPAIANFPAGTGINDINWPAKHRANAGFDFSYLRLLGNMTVNHTTSAYWQDVLDARFAGMTRPFTMVNAALGVRWAHQKVVTSLKITNLLNEEVQQHIFGDIIRRQIVGEVRIQF